MVNQWGRDGNFTSPGGRSSGGAIIAAAIIALVIGGGGGYAGARMLGGVPTADLTARDSRIVELEREISDLKFARSDTAGDEDELRAQIQDLTRANASLKAQIDDTESAATGDARAEIEALKKTIEEAGDTRTELNRARRSLQVSELQIIELEGQIKTQRSDIDKLTRDLADTAATKSGDERLIAQNESLQNQIRTLNNRLQVLNKSQEKASALQTRLTASEADLAVRTSDLNAARGALSTVQKDAERARADLAKARSDLARTLSSVKTMTATLDEATARATALEEQRRKLSDSLTKATAETTRLEDQVASLQRTVDRLKADNAGATPRPDDQPVSDPDASPSRDAAQVRDALDRMPGYERITTARQAELAQRLESGECVADALKNTLGRVPAVALRNLLRDLGSKC